MSVCFLGAGTWGFCLASLLASKGFDTISWTRDAALAESLNASNEHPYLKGHAPLKNMSFTTDLEEALREPAIIVESISSAGFRSVFEQVKSISTPSCAIVITSKGIEQNSGLILPDVLLEVFGSSIADQVACLSGPSYAVEVLKELPTSVVVAAFDPDLMIQIADLFTTPSFRVYPNSDIMGVAYGGALKNIIAIACGISDGLGLGFSARAAIMTRGLHEIRKLAVAKGCRADTLNGLSGMGDLCVTCSSLISRNCRFGYLLAQGLRPKEAYRDIGNVVEGAYTCVSALQLSRQLEIPMPITETVYKIIYEGLPLSDAVQALMGRPIKGEHL